MEKIYQIFQIILEMYIVLFENILISSGNYVWKYIRLILPMTVLT